MADALVTAGRITTDNLLEFTKEIQDKLPREIRNMIYKCVPDAQVMDAMWSNAKLPPKLGLYRYSGFVYANMKQPGCLHPPLVDTQFLTELIRAFYEKCEMRTRHVSMVEPLLNRDFFGLGVRPNMCTLSALEVGTELRNIDPMTLAEHFAPLLRPGQISSRFRLDIILESRAFICKGLVWSHKEPCAPLIQAEMEHLALSLKASKTLVDTITTLSRHGWFRMTIDLGFLSRFNISILELDGWAEKSANYWIEKVAKKVRCYRAVFRHFWKDY
ncbi:hypothetical protein BDW02DRAFT_49247 [Decorospora gaudefroyi]|uniref:Uncharacterized protein n=1 Tax=Decorospora gaudefroyi TaxID=184978 RepID=A0A6A5KI69_9PLEO|nr:hypothetical protein BDW02DRAFT_49247 [Decorospora gaudefroyi]